MQVHSFEWIIWILLTTVGVAVISAFLPLPMAALLSVIWGLVTSQMAAPIAKRLS